MKYIILILLTLGVLISCDPIDNYVDTGISSGKHDCSMYEYFHTSSYNWDSTILMIQQAGLENLFEGREPGYEQITFFGVTNHSIRRYMIENGIKRIKDMTPEFCRTTLMAYVVKKRIMKENIDFRIPDAGKEILGGTIIVTEGGRRLHAYKEQAEWGGVANAGAVTLSVFSYTADKAVPMASPNIETLTGVIHALNYNHTLGEL